MLVIVFTSIVTLLFLVSLVLGFKRHDRGQIFLSAGLLIGFFTQLLIRLIDLPDWLVVILTVIGVAFLLPSIVINAKKL